MPAQPKTLYSRCPLRRASFTLFLRGRSRRLSVRHFPLILKPTAPSIEKPSCGISCGARPHPLLFCAAGIELTTNNGRIGSLENHQQSNGRTTHADRGRKSTAVASSRGLRLHIRQEGDATRWMFLFHHCLGRWDGRFLFISDLLVAYSHFCSRGPGSPPLHLLDPIASAQSQWMSAFQSQGQADRSGASRAYNAHSIYAARRLSVMTSEHNGMLQRWTPRLTTWCTI